MRLIHRAAVALIVLVVPTAHAAETALISKNDGGTDAGNSYSSLDNFRRQPYLDRYVVYSSAATDLTGDPDPNASEDVFLHDTATDTTELVSWNLTNSAAASGSSSAAIASADGRWVAFKSNAVDIHPLFSGGYDAVFVRDRVTDSTHLVTLDLAGSGAANGDSTPVGFSSDGRFVLFSSEATDLVALPDTNGGRDYFVRDLTAGTTTLVSIDFSGASTGDLPSSQAQAVLAGGGRYVAFVSEATDLVPVDANGFADVFLRDLELGVTTLVSVTAAGTASGNERSDIQHVSQDGRWAAFSSVATNLTNDPDGDATGDSPDVFLRDLEQGVTHLVSVSRDGASGNYDSEFARVSEDGRFVVFVSDSTNLLPADTPSGRNIFVRDMIAQTTELVSISFDGTTTGNDQSAKFEISTNGRFVAFGSEATNLVSMPDNNNDDDGFIRDRLLGITDLLTINGAGTETAEHGVSTLRISSDGRFFTFHTDASDLGHTDTNNESDVYRVEHDLAETVDFGDAPAPYPVGYGADGAMHLVTGLFLGAAIDGEPGAPPPSPATGDDEDGIDDEDGVALPDQFLPGVPLDIDVTASAPGLLNAWIDFNRDGDWDDGDEQVFSDEALLSGVNTIGFTPPVSAVPGITYARFRFDSGGGLSPAGFAADGEVEDYAIVNTRDIFADGFESGDTSAWSDTVP